ncbi:hypothetical protein MPLA_940014 [Mesorhizobium sp. ORS 3359]|nr:hypothetical protein MPLA_940014 [Mesorhizobium sp. ORS 3359]
MSQSSVTISGRPVSATEVTAVAVAEGTTVTLQPYPCSIRNLETAVTIEPEAQFISVIVTSPHFASAAVAASVAINAAAQSLSMRESIVFSCWFSIPGDCPRQPEATGPVPHVRNYRKTEHLTNEYNSGLTSPFSIQAPS